MVTIIGQHEFKDFATWKVVFEADVPNREKIGIKTIDVLTSVKNPNDVTFIMEAPSIEIFNAMMSSPELQEKMKSSGVISIPVMNVFNKV